MAALNGLWFIWKSILIRRSRRLPTVGTGLILAAGPFACARGHAFGQRFDLPIPLNYYLAGAAGAVFFSFVLLAIFARAPMERGAPYPRFNLLRWRAVGYLTHPWLLAALRLFVALLFLLILAAGLFGTQDPRHNLLPTMVWIIWWTGMAYVCALIGDLWALVNPWNTLFGWAESLYGYFSGGRRELALNLRYPSRLGVWPACVFFAFFVWGELIWTGNAVPADLAVAAIVYSAVTWVGMLLFGRETWLRKGEAFSLAFGMLARVAPTEIRVDPGAAGTEVCERCREHEDGVNCYECFGRVAPQYREWNLRPFGAGLLVGNAVSISMMFFVVLLLSTVSFDGFMGTSLWVYDIQGALPDWRALRPFLFMMEMSGISREVVISTAGLCLFPILFAGAYLSMAWIMSATARFSRDGNAMSAIDIAAFFVFSLLPIALAYHLAHYLSFLLTVGQLVIPLASDPFGLGWDLFGTAHYRLNIGLVGALFVWYTSVISIVVGHVIAVCIGHLLAFRVLRDRKSVLVSQVPMLALMIFYTVFSLWILAQPLIEA